MRLINHKILLKVIVIVLSLTKTVSCGRIGERSPTTREETAKPDSSIEKTIDSLRNKTSDDKNKPVGDEGRRSLPSEGRQGTHAIFVREKEDPPTRLLPPRFDTSPDTDFHSLHDHTHSYDNHSPSHHHEGTPENSHTNDTGYDYTSVHKDSVFTVLDSVDGFIRHSDERSDICAKCLCTLDLLKVSCEHIDHESKDYKLTIEPTLIPNQTRYIQIRGYNEVTVQPGTFVSERTQLVAIIFEDIGNLILKKNSFNIAENANKNVELTIQFVNVNMTSLPSEAITQRIQGAHGRHSRVNLRAKRFLSLVIHRCHIKKIEQHALTHSRLIYLNISHTQIDKIERKGMDLEVYELSLFKMNTFPPLIAEALCLHAKKVVFTENYFEDIGNHSIVIETDSQVLFEFNRVKRLREEALKGIVPINKYGANIVFHRNTVWIAEPRSLVIDPLFPVHERKVFNNSFKIQCNCSIDQYFHSVIGSDPEGHDFGDSFKILLRRTQCMRPYSGKYELVHTYLDLECAPFPILVVTSVSIAFVLFVIAISVCVVCSLRMQHLRDEAKSLGECTSQSFSTLNRPHWPPVEMETTPCNSTTMSPIWIQTGGTAFPFALAMPEVKTYQQNEVNDFTEWTESIRGSTATSMDILGKKELRPKNRASCPFN